MARPQGRFATHRPVSLGTLAAGLLVGGARSQEPPTLPEPPPRGTGAPPCVSFCAKPSDTGLYVGYYVGGGVACHGGPRLLNEGTWGWDYCGCLLHPTIFLHWTHGFRYQGGTGSYQIDGPELLKRHKKDKESQHENHGGNG
jgi:hypothetical protein